MSNNAAASTLDSQNTCSACMLLDTNRFYCAVYASPPTSLLHTNGMDVGVGPGKNVYLMTLKAAHLRQDPPPQRWVKGKLPNNHINQPRTEGGGTNTPAPGRFERQLLQVHSAHTYAKRVEAHYTLPPDPTYLRLNCHFSATAERANEPDSSAVNIFGEKACTKPALPAPSLVEVEQTAVKLIHCGVMLFIPLTASSHQSTGSRTHEENVHMYKFVCTHPAPRINHHTLLVTNFHT